MQEKACLADWLSCVGLHRRPAAGADCFDLLAIWPAGSGRRQTSYTRSSHDANKNLASATTGGTMSGVSFTTAQDDGAKMGSDLISV